MVDDHPVNRDVLVLQLELLGIAADSAANGVEALRTRIGCAAGDEERSSCRFRHHFSPVTVVQVLRDTNDTKPTESDIGSIRTRANT